jgi:hypothetical protein
MGNTEIVPIAGLYAFIFKYPLIPVPPARDWGQRPILKGILPRMGSHQSRFERYSIGFGFNKLKRVRDSHRTEKIGW